MQDVNKYLEPVAEEIVRNAHAALREEEKRLAGAQVAATAASDAARRADPTTPHFARLVHEHLIANASLATFEDRAKDARAHIEKAKATAGVAKEKVAELRKEIERARKIDEELYELVRSTRSAARAKLRELENSLGRTAKLEQEIADMRGVHVPSYALPRHYGTVFSFHTDSSAADFLAHLESVVQSPDLGVSRGAAAGWTDAEHKMAIESPR